MIGDYIVVAFVYAIGLSFLGCIHHFWLRDAFREETPPLDGLVENEGRGESHSVLNESSSNAGCQPSHFAIEASSRSQRNNREPFNPGATTLVGRKPASEKKMFLRERKPALSQTLIESSASRSSAARTKPCNTTRI
jgi:hypothetical protein